MNIVKFVRTSAAIAVLGALVSVNTPQSARADVLNNLSIRVSGFFPSRSDVRSIVSGASLGVGADYRLGWFPHLFNGEAWSTSVSADVNYSSQHGQTYTSIPIMLNQVYTFEQQGSWSPYAGFCVGVADFNSSGVHPVAVVGAASFAGKASSRVAEAPGGNVHNAIRVGAGLILGSNWGNHMYFEGKYLLFQQVGAHFVPDGLRALVGFRF